MSLDSLITLVPSSRGAVIAAADGDVRTLAQGEARQVFGGGNVIVAHGAFVAGRLQIVPAKPLYDVLELFVFVRPAVAFVPSALAGARWVERSQNSRGFGASFVRDCANAAG